jgi:hypothetical protein
MNYVDVYANLKRAMISVVIEAMFLMIRAILLLIANLSVISIKQQLKQKQTMELMFRK